MSVFSRLLASLHDAVFDTTPVSVTAFRLSHAGGAVYWSVLDETLTATVAGSPHTYALAEFTLASLVAALQADGFVAAEVDDRLLSRSAAILLELSGQSDLAFGDRVMAADNDLLRALFGGYARELRGAKLAVTEAIKQIVIPTSAGEWLANWGRLFGINRKTGQSDAEFAAYIPQEVARERINNIAIQQAIKDETGQSIYIREPWRDMFRLDARSTLSGQHRTYDGTTVGPHLIQPIAYGSADWTGVPEVIDRNRAAGVIMMDPEIQIRRGVMEPAEGPIATVAWSCTSERIRSNDACTLDHRLRLSAHEIAYCDRPAVLSAWGAILVAGERSSYFDVVSSRLVDNAVVAGLVLEVGASCLQRWGVGPVAAYPPAEPQWQDLASWNGDQVWSGQYDIRIGTSATMISSTWITQTTWADEAWSAV